MSASLPVSFLKKRPKFFFILLLLLIDLVIAVAYVQATNARLIVAFLNVGQGDAIFIQAPNGTQLLYDAGPPSGAVLRELSRLMPFWDRSIDVLVLSHPDADHIGGALDVLNRYHVDVVLESGASSTSSVYRDEEKLIGTKHIPELLARTHMEISLGGGVFADILYPDIVTPTEDTNDASVVMRLRYGSTSFMFSGDLPQRGEYQVLKLERSILPPVDVLKLGHHGSRTSSSEAWLSTLHPEVAIISAGLHNRYGHPHKEVLDLLTKLRIPSLATFTDGTITFESDGVSVRRK